MKIERVESIVLLEKFHIVRVHTDDGLVGLGEVSPMGPGVTHAFVEDVLAPLIVGRDSSDIERIWHDMYHVPHKLGPMGAQLNAMAGIDVALWDITAQRAGVPLYVLLGGKVRDRVEVYASSMSRDMEPVDEARRAARLQEQGYGWYKTHSATRWMYDRGPDRTVDTVREVRAACGDDFQIMVDVNNAYLPHTAVRIARQLEQYGVFHFEEPIAEHDLDGYARLVSKVDVAIAAGEQRYTRWQFLELIQQGHVDIVQPDVVKCGGITEFRKIAAVAGAFNRPITVHNTQPVIGTMAHQHLWLSTPGCIYPQEYNIERHALRDDWPIAAVGPVVEDGFLAPPTRPGLGIELDEDVIAKIRST